MNEQANTIIKVCSRFCHLKLVKIHINSILDELSDGFNLISLVEILSGKQVNNGRYKQSATSRFHRAENINILLNYLKEYIKRSFNSDRILDEDPIEICDLVWSIIEKFYIQCISFNKKEGKAALLQWCQKNTENHNNIKIVNFTSSWNSGLGFCALIHNFRPELIDYDSLDAANNVENCQKAFDICKEIGLIVYLDPNDVANPRPNEKSILLQVSEFYKFFTNSNETVNLEEVKKMQEEIDQIDGVPKNKEINQQNDDEIKRKSIFQIDKEAEKLRRQKEEEEIRIEKEQRMKELERRDKERKEKEAEKRRIQIEEEEAIKLRKENEEKIREMTIKVYSLKSDLKVLDQNLDIKHQQMIKDSQIKIDFLIQSRDMEIKSIQHSFGAQLSNSDAHQNVPTAEIEDQIPEIASKKKRIAEEEYRALELYKYSHNDEEVMQKINASIYELKRDLNSLRLFYSDEIQKLENERKATLDRLNAEKNSQIQSLIESTDKEINSIHENDKNLLSQLQKEKEEKSAEIEAEIEILNKKINELKEK